MRCLASPAARPVLPPSAPRAADAAKTSLRWSEALPGVLAAGLGGRTCQRLARADRETGRAQPVARAGVRPRARRRRLIELGLLGGAGIASAEAEVDDSDYSAKAKRLLEDPEVKFIRDLQAKLELVDGRSGRRVALPKLLKPGGALHDADLLCIGEIHDSPGDHAVQRLLLDALTYALFLELRSSEGVAAAAPRGRTPQNLSPQRVAVGVEYFSRQQQPTLDTLIFDKSKDALGSSPSKFREACDWDRVWSYDWELYAPLFRFCQLNLNRIVGLNLPLEAVLVVSRGGLEAAPEWLREQLPPLDLTQEKHRRRFEDMLRMPLEDAVGRMSLPLSNWSPKQELNKMYQAQVLWDEYMANTAAKYLTDVGGRLVVLAGTNHVWRDAIPERFERMTASRASAGDPPRKAVSVAACLRPIGHFQRHPVPASRSDRPIGWSPIRRCHGVGSNCHL
ncbi:unnamed protein product [Durusdinium trenchii]|uniref:Haem-binding uptake Tiki superfamily ChaN domain-containing protein n=1 Tax=Durusdinium trenchii TaxID=1381693 RepID=A0ABP0S7I8_9DINO